MLHRSPVAVNAGRQARTAPLAAKARLILCPYCGNTQQTPHDRCASCGGFFDPRSLKVSQKHMGPWFIRDRDHPFRPGCSYEVLVREIEQGKIKPTTILRGPTTRQFWSVARNVAGVAHRLGYCHACGAHVQPNDARCPQCDAVFFSPKLRDQLGLAEAHAEVTTGQGLKESGALRATVNAAEMTRDAPQRESQPPHEPASETQPEPAAGSPILAGLRTTALPPTGERSPAGGPHEPTPATSPATDDDALAWLISGDDAKPDTPQPTAPPTTTTPEANAPRSGRMARLGQIGWLTWLLIAINVLLFAGAIITLLVLITGGSPDDATRPQTDRRTPEAEAPDAPTEAAQPTPPTDRQPPGPARNANTAAGGQADADAADRPPASRTSDATSEPSDPEPRLAPRTTDDRAIESKDKNDGDDGPDAPGGGTFFGIPTDAPANAPERVTPSPIPPDAPDEPRAEPSHPTDDDDADGAGPGAGAEDPSGAGDAGN